MKKYFNLTTILPLIIRLIKILLCYLISGVILAIIAVGLIYFFIGVIFSLILMLLINAYLYKVFASKNFTDAIKISLISMILLILIITLIFLSRIVFPIPLALFFIINFTYLYGFKDIDFWLALFSTLFYIFVPIMFFVILGFVMYRH